MKKEMKDRSKKKRGGGDEEREERTREYKQSSRKLVTFHFQLARIMLTAVLCNYNHHLMKKSASL